MKCNFTICLFLFFCATLYGQFESRTITVGGQTREYELFVPQNYDGQEPLPLVINLHGYGSNADQQIQVSLLHEVADTAGFMVAYPEGLEVDISGLDNLNPFLPEQGRGWNLWGELSDNDDLAFIGQLIDAVDAEYGLQLEQVYATGLSMGGIMTHYLACALSDRIAAAASVAGDLPRDDRFVCQPARPTPIIHMHGTNDPVVPFEEVYTGIGAEATVEFWRQTNGCAMDSSVTAFEDIDMTDGSTATRIRYGSCEEDSEVVFYRIDNGGHTWPGGPELPLTLGFTNQDFSASAEIWNFFSRFRLEDVTNVETLNPVEVDLKVFPNPFSQQLNFNFALNQTAPVRITMYNQLGQPVKVLADDRLGVGQHQIKWAPGGQLLPSGVYYYRLQIAGRFVSGRVVLRDTN